MAQKRLPLMLVGLEIEGEVKISLTEKFPVGEYHRPEWASNDWGLESDSSLRLDKWKNDGRVAEFISRPMEHTEVVPLLKKLKREVFGNAPMKDCLNINDSCGNHIHISLVTPKTSKDRLEELPVCAVRECEDYGCETCYYVDENGNAHVNSDNPYYGGTYYTIKKGRRAWGVKGKKRTLPLSIGTVNRIRKTIRSFLPEIAAKRYFRDHAKQTRKGRMFNSDKYREWHPIDKCHYEYRSFNLTGVETWEELFGFYEAAINAIYYNLVLAPTKEMDIIKFNADSLNEETDQKASLCVFTCEDEQNEEINVDSEEDFRLLVSRHRGRRSASANYEEMPWERSSEFESEFSDEYLNQPITATWGTSAGVVATESRQVFGVNSFDRPEQECLDDIEDEPSEGSSAAGGYITDWFSDTDGE